MEPGQNAGFEGEQQADLETELEAIRKVTELLTALPQASQQTVLNYVSDRLLRSPFGFIRPRGCMPPLR